MADIHIDMLVTAVAPKKPLTSVHVTLWARWYQSASFYSLDIRNISSRSMVLKAVYWSSWRKSFPAQSGQVLGWKLNRMESIGTQPLRLFGKEIYYNLWWTSMLLLLLSFVLKSLEVMHHFRAVWMISVIVIISSVIEILYINVIQCQLILMKHLSSFLRMNILIYSILNLGCCISSPLWLYYTSVITSCTIWL